MRAAAAALAAAATLVAPAAAHATGASAPTLQARLDRGTRRADARVAPPAARRLAADARAARAVDRRPGRLARAARRGDWVKVRLPNRPNRAAAWIAADRVVLRPTRWRVEINVARGA